MHLFHFSLSFGPWCFFKWFLKTFPNLHCLHLKGFSPVCFILCFLRLSTLNETKLQILHFFVSKHWIRCFTPLCSSMCEPKLLLFENICHQKRTFKAFLQSGIYCGRSDNPPVMLFITLCAILLPFCSFSFFKLFLSCLLLCWTKHTFFLS